MGSVNNGRQIAGRGHIYPTRDWITLYSRIIVRSRHGEAGSQRSAMQSLDTHVADLA
jgi:hypothetical protein